MGDQANYTKEGLPVVRQATVDVLIRDVIVRDRAGTYTEYIGGLLGQIDRTNSAIGAYISRVAEIIAPDDVQMQLRIMAHMGGLYEILRKEAEAYKLEDHVNGASSPK